MVSEEDLAFGAYRLLDVTERLVIPAQTPIDFLISSTDVIHSYSVPSFGVKMDAVPGRINTVPISIRHPGIYYGQCSELCGVYHSFMPVAVDVQIMPSGVSHLGFVPCIDDNTLSSNLSNLHSDQAINDSVNGTIDPVINNNITNISISEHIECVPDGADSASQSINNWHTDAA